MIGNKKILAIIPARSGSKGVPKKNTRLLGKKPLIEHIIQVVQKSKYIDKLIISTDDEEVLRIAKAQEVEVPFKRPDELSTDSSPLIAVVQHHFQYYKQNNELYKSVLSIQPTCPYLKTDTIEKMIELWDKTDCDSVTTIAEYQTGHPYIAQRFDLESKKIDRFCQSSSEESSKRRQEREIAYYLTGGAYLRASKLLDQKIMTGHCLGVDSRAVIVDQFEAVDINTEIDFQFAEFLLKSDLMNE